jgi:hypothetical protein
MEQYKRINNEIIIKSLMSHYGIVSDCAKELSVYRQTLSKWIKEDVELQKAQIEARENLKDFCEGNLIKGIEKGNPILTIFTLKCLAKDRGYIDTYKQEIEITQKSISISFEPQSLGEFKEVVGITQGDSVELLPDNEVALLPVDNRERDMNGRYISVEPTEESDVASATT